MTSTSSTITLRALEGEPLDVEQVRRMVIATAHAIAERQGLSVIKLCTTANSITLTLNAGRVEAMGLATELRRLTTNWYTKKFDSEHLWGPVHDDSDGEQWKV